MICVIWQYFVFYLCSLVLKKNNQSVNSIEVLESANIFYNVFSKEIYCAYLTNFYLYKYDITLKQISNDDKDNILHQQLC